MSNSNDFASNLAHALRDDEITSLVAEQLPHWKAACDHVGADSVFLNQRAFGRSEDELRLLGAAIKYAGIAKKNVTIGWDENLPVDAASRS
jgi:phage gpG-like protein